MRNAHLEQDYEYFKTLWEERRSSQSTHTARVWDSRARDWDRELAQNGSFCRSLGERIGTVSDYLRSKGLLNSHSQVLDLGCGPGRFAAEFARTAGHVTGFDLSPHMVAAAAAYSAACGLKNISFVTGDFLEIDPKEYEWERKFDLVFTSITPAIGTVKALDKVISITRGYCFNSSFILWEDELEKQIAVDVYGQEYRPLTSDRGQSFYALFNLLWLRGYCPETSYHFQEQSDYTEAGEDLARYYAKCFSESMMASGDDIRRIQRYLKEQAGSDGTILRTFKRWYGWILWGVEARTERMGNQFFDR